jgi:hypothetical protein
MIPVRMRQKQGKITPPVGQKGIARFADSRSGINQQNVVTVIPDFQTGRIAAIV